MISVIIPAHNEEKFIAQCLESIKAQTYKDVEIIVVCDACRDSTAKVAKAYTNNVYSINKLHPSFARNYGAEKAVGDVFAFIDADSVMKKNLLEEVNKTVRHGYVGGTCNTRALENVLIGKIMWRMGDIANKIFLTASGFMFCKAEYFPSFRTDIKIAEDTYFLLALKKKGKVKCITNSYIKTSTRRFEKNGYIKTLYTQIKGFFITKNHKYNPVHYSKLH